MKRTSTKTRRALRGSRKTIAAATTSAILSPPAGEPLNVVRKPIPRRWRGYHRRLLELRERLNQARGDRLIAASEPLDHISMDMADVASDEIDRDLALSELSAEQNTLFEIEAALKRMQAGTYGICEATGKPIPRARLMAMPWTRFAGEVESRLERAGVVGRSRLGELRSVVGPATGDLEATDSEREELEPAPTDEALSTFPGAGVARRRRTRRLPPPRSAQARSSGR